MNPRGLFSSSLNWVSLIRPYNVLPPVLAMLIACIYAGGAPLLSCVVGVLLIILLHSEATIRNDLRDKDVDTTNNRQGVLFENSKVHENYARWIMCSCIILSLLAVVYLQSIAIGLLVALSLVLSWVYSSKPLQLSRRPISSIILLGILYGALPVFLGYLLSNKTISVPQALALAATWFLLRASVSILKDYKDESGDKKHGKQTFLIAYGSNAVALTSIALALVAYILLVIKLIGSSSASTQMYIALLVVCMMTVNLVLRTTLLSNKSQQIVLARNIFQLQNYIDIGVLVWVIV